MQKSYLDPFGIFTFILKYITLDSVIFIPAYLKIKYLPDTARYANENGER
jgi:hypothetical protein